MRQVSDRVKVEREQEYKLLGVKWYGKGTFHRETVTGANTSATYLTPVIPGAFIYNRLFAWKESFAVVPLEHAGCFVSNEFPQFIVDENLVLAEYLYLFFTLDTTIQIVNALSVGSAAVSRNRFKEEEFLQFEIPLPPLETQRAIVARWQTAQAEIATAHEQAQHLSDSIAKEAIRDVGISLKSLVKRPAAYVLSWSKAERWGVEFNRWDWTPENLLSCSQHPMVQLTEVAWVNPLDTITLPDSDLASFVPMAAVSGELGEILTPEIRPYQEVKSGYTRFLERDVIWAKITPCMQNGKCAVARNLENGVGCGSTEFHVVRSKDIANVLPEYIWVILRLRHIRQAAQRYFIGSAGQQRVAADFLEDLHIPLPPLDVQREIVQRVEAGRAEIARLREQAAQRAQESTAEVEAVILGKGGFEHA